MVAASRPEGRSKEDFVDEFLTCSICAEPFDSVSGDHDHQAKCLPCLHTYCKACLQSIAGKKSTFDCPKCRKLITLPGGTVDSLPNNFLVENLMEYQNIFNLEVSCGNCDKGGPALTFCNDCGCFQCQRCTDTHQEIRSMRHHQMVPIEQLRAKKSNPMIQQLQHCKKHPKQELTLYCKNDNCKLPVCASCGLVDHRTHELIHFDAAIDEIITAMRQSSDIVNKRNSYLVKKRVEIESLQKTIAGSFAKIENDLHQSEQNLIDLIKERYSKAHRDLKDLLDEASNKLDTNIVSLDFLAAQMSSACEFANQACDISHPTQLLTSQNQIMERLNELEKAELPNTTASDNTDFEFTEKHHSAMTQIKESLQDVCDIRWNAKVDPQQCTVQLGLASEQEGYWKKAIVQTVDSNGHKMALAGANVEVLQDGAPPYIVQDNNDGTYTFNYNQVCELLLRVKVNGIEIKESPVCLHAIKPQIDPHQCTIQLGLYADNGYKNASVQTVDRYGHNIAIGGANIKAEGNQHGLVDNKDGTYTIRYNPFNRGSLHVKINGNEMKGSPFVVYGK
ncbi:E3 ubiquitin-protein ligase TRIM45-like [Amphiura filiformis]|uniref:E3 ubiquitin-protein ligase TRIM45-like n=1 Tax=Amphiura filiformis TaxID=82378 RepID=UPI003B21AB5E